jgi:hypothetical protein
MDAILKLDLPVSSFFDHADPAMVERLTGYTREFDKNKKCTISRVHFYI